MNEEFLTRTEFENFLTKNGIKILSLKIKAKFGYALLNYSIGGKDMTYKLTLNSDGDIKSVSIDTLMNLLKHTKPNL